MKRLKKASLTNQEWVLAVTDPQSNSEEIQLQSLQFKREDSTKLLPLNNQMLTLLKLEKLDSLMKSKIWLKKEYLKEKWKAAEATLKKNLIKMKLHHKIRVIKLQVQTWVKVTLRKTMKRLCS